MNSFGVLGGVDLEVLATAQLADRGGALRDALGVPERRGLGEDQRAELRAGRRSPGAPRSALADANGMSASATAAATNDLRERSFMTTSRTTCGAPLGAAPDARTYPRAG